MSPTHLKLGSLFMKTGRRSKDSPISDQFNENKVGNLSQKVLKKAKKVVESIEERDRRKAEEVSRKKEKESATDERDLNHEKSAMQMLADMRWVYRQIAGRTKLKELCQSDSEFKFLVKELMRIESAILTAQIRKEGPDVSAGNQTTFVILKGLDDEKSILGITEETPESKQISILLNPDGTEREKMN